MLFLCHDFYEGLANITINTATLARFGAPAARRLWDTIKNEGLKKDGIGKIKSTVENETERLNREAKEAIANGTAKVTEIDLKSLDEKTEEGKRGEITTDWTKKGLSKMALMMRGDYHGPAPEISRANQENLKHGYYVLSEEEKKTLNENNNDISPLYKALEKAGHGFLPDLRKKAGLEENRRNAGSNHEENRLFLPTKKAKEEIKKFCGEDIRIFNNLFPTFNSNITEDIIFCALHRSYKLGKAASALGSRMRGMLTNILEQIRNRAYAPNPWDEVLGNPAFAEWPLKEYGMRLKAYRESLQNIKQPETSWGQRAWQSLGRLFPQGRDAEVPEWRGIKKEEDKKLAQPAGNGFPPTPFDLAVLTNSAEAEKVGADNSVTDALHMENLQKVFRMFNIIETEFNTNLNITSGYRTKSTVEALIAAGYSASKKSDHLEGLAMDFALPADKHCELMKFLRENYSDTISQAISYIEAKSPNGTDLSYFHIAIGATKSTKQFASHIGRNNFIHFDWTKCKN